MPPDLQADFGRALAQAAAELGVTDSLDPVVEPSAVPEAGDYSSALAFRLAGVLRRSPRAIAAEIAAMMAERPLPHGGEITVSGAGYINLRIDFAALTPSVIRTALEWGDVVSPDPGAGPKIVVEHTATNPNKAAHVGHLRNACIGDTVARLLRARGNRVEVQNYIDDTGAQVADVLVGIRNLGLSPRDGEPFDRFCSRVYVEVCRRYEREPELTELRVQTLRQIEGRQGEVARAAKDLAGKIVDAHLQTMSRVGVSYDLLTWESDIIELGFLGHALDWMREAKVLVKSDGMATYTSKDIAYHLWKFGVLGLDFDYRLWSPQGPATTTADSALAQLPSDRFGRAARVVNVIDQRQSAPQRVVKEALRRLGFVAQAGALHHLAYEVVALSPNAATALGIDTSEGKTMYTLSGRLGIDVGADDLLDEAERQVQSKARDQATAARLAASAVRYYLLRFGLNSIINFDFGEALRTSGDTGVYLQYAHARACGILAKVKPLPLPEHATALSPIEQSLVKLLERFPRVVAEAAEGLSPSTLAAYTFSLATAFNDFYEHSDRLYRIEDPELRGLRRGLVDATRATLARSLELLGLTPLTRI